MFEPAILAQILWTGIASSAPYVLLTVGFAPTLKVTGLWNFAQAGQMAIAALFIVAGMYLIGSHGGIVPNTPLELVLSAVIGTLLGGIGRVFAVAAASVFLALIQSFSILFIGSRWQNLLLYGFLFATILLFPRGVRMPGLRLRMPRPRLSVR